MSLQVLYGWTGLEGNGVGFQNIMCVLQEGGIPENDFCAARPGGGGGLLKIMSCCRTLGGGSVCLRKNPPPPHQDQVSSHIPGTRHNGKGASEAGSDPRGRPRVTWGVYLCAGKPPLADIILSHPPDLI